MVKLLSSGGDTYRRFHLPVRFHVFKKAQKTRKLLRYEQGMSSEHESQTWLDIQFCHITYAVWRRLPHIYVSSSVFQREKAQIR
jgi:hypothetical protein